MSKTPLVLYAALFVTGAVAVYGLSTSLSLRAELEQIRKAPEAVALLEEHDKEPREPLGVGSDEDRIQALEAAVRRQESELDALRLSIVRLASQAGNLEVGPDGELSGAVADSVLSLVEKERQKQIKERQDKRIAEIADIIATKREAFASANNLSSTQRDQLVSLEENTQKVVRSLMEDVSSGNSNWRDIRPQARELATDTVGQLKEILGEEKANAYLSSLQEDLPMIGRWTRPDREDPRP